MTPSPVFDAPWHAQLFALTVALNAAGHFTWPDWTKRFGATLKDHGLSKSLNGGDDYFTAWLVTLETLLHDTGTADPETLSALRAAWKEAYLSTEHGHPVTLNASFHFAK